MCAFSVRGFLPSTEHLFPAGQLKRMGPKMTAGGSSGNGLVGMKSLNKLYAPYALLPTVHRHPQLCALCSMAARFVVVCMC